MTDPFIALVGPLEDDGGGGPGDWVAVGQLAGLHPDARPWLRLLCQAPTDLRWRRGATVWASCSAPTGPSGPYIHADDDAGSLILEARNPGGVSASYYIVPAWTEG